MFINGHPFRFDVLATSDPSMIAELDKCVARGVGGVIAITQEEHDLELKKKDSLSPSSSNSNQRPHRAELSALLAPRAVEAVNRGGAFNPNGMFARPQEPQVNMASRMPSRAMPDPIEASSAESFKGSFVVKPPLGRVP